MRIKLSTLRTIIREELARLQEAGGQPTPEQMAALKDYAAWAGPDWKNQLQTDWMRAGSRWPGEWAYLQQLRNQLGPSWLATFELDEGVY